MELRLVLGLIGVYCSDVLFGLYLVAAFYSDIFEVGLHGEILAMADDDDGIGTRQFDYTGHLTFEHSAGLGTFGGGNVDAVVGDGDLVGDHRSVLAEG